MIDIVVLTGIVCNGKRAKFTMLDDWSHIGLPKLFAEIIPIIPLVGSNRL